MDDSGRIDGYDLIAFSLAYGSSPGSQHWNETADLNEDGIVDDDDLAILRKYFGTIGIAQGCWVANFGSGEIVKVGGKGGNELARRSGFSQPQYVAVNLSEGACWASDSGHGQVVKLSSDGGTELARVSGFSNPLSVSANALDGSCWVADSGESRLVRLDASIPDGYNVTTDVGFDVIVQGFSNPRGVSVDPVRAVCWVADGQQVVQVSGDVPDGYDISQDTGFHSSISGFSSAACVSVNIIDGACWVSDSGSNEVVKLASGGMGELIRVGGFANPISLSANSFDGSCWVADQYHNQVVRLGADDAAVLARVGGFDQPVSISAEMLGGGCWVADRDHDQVVKLSANGQETFRVNGFSRPVCVAATPGEQGEQPPQAVAVVSPTFVDVSETVTFDASNSQDTNGTIIRYEWDFEGDGVYDWRLDTSPTSGGGLASESETHSYDSAGIYNPILRVTDDDWLTDVDYSQVVHVGSLTAIAHANPTSGEAPLQVQFTGEAIDPADGRVENYQWDFDGDGTFDDFSETTPNTSHVYENSGSYAATLKVTDTGNVTAVDSVQIEVSQALPTAYASAVPLEGSAPLLVQFSGSGSDPDGSVVLYQWDFDGDTAFDWANVSNGYATYSYTEDDVYSAVLRVTDDDGLTGTDTVSITVNPAPPVAIIRVDPPEGEAGSTVFHFDGSDSSHPTGTISEFWWDFGDQTGADGPVVTHTYSEAGLFTVMLTVVGDDAGVGVAEATVRVRVAGAPLAVASAEPTSGPAPLSVDFSAEGSYDPDGEIVLYEWDFEGGAFGDDMETGEGQWTADEPWDLVTSDAHSPTHCWTDSPGGNYANRTDAAIGTRPVNLASAAELTLVFWHHYAMEYGYDSGLVEISADGGDTWGQLARYTGTNTQWTKEEIDLSAYEGQTAIRIRFRLVTDGSVTYDGWYIDDVEIGGGPGVFDWSDPASGTVTHTYEIPGIYHPLLRVTDNDDLMATDSLVVRVLARPNAEILSPTSGSSHLRSGVCFIGQGSDIDGEVTRYEWDFDGDGTYDWESSATGYVCHAYDSPGEVTATLRVTDNDGLTDIESVTFFAIETGPRQVEAFAEPTEGNAPLCVAFSGVADDQDGDIVTYEWDLDGDGVYDWSNGGTAGLVQSFSSQYGESYGAAKVIDGELGGYWMSAYRASFPHEFVFSLDRDQAWDIDSVRLTPTSNQNNARRPRGFEILVSTDFPGGEFTSVGTFEFPDSSTTETFTFPAASARYVKLRITSNYGDSSYTALAEFEVYASVENVISPVSARTWWTYETAATYHATLRATDNDGLAGTDPVTITVNPAGSPRAFAQVLAELAYVTQAIRFLGTGTDENGQVVRYEWDFDGDGTYDWLDENTGTLESYTSQYNSSTYAAANLIDGQTGSGRSWLSQYPVTFPQELVFSFSENATQSIDMVTLNADTGISSEYQAKDFEVLVSTTGMEASDFASVGSFALANRTTDQTFNFAPTDAKYVKLRITSNYGSTNYVALAEFEVYDANAKNNLLALCGNSWHVYDTAGERHAVLRVTDDEGLTDTDGVVISVRPIGEGLAACWVANKYSVVRLDANGDEIARVTGFSNGYCVSVNATDGACWVADYSSGEVVKLSADVPDGYDVSVDTGSHITVHGFDSPLSVSVNSADGSCWVADYYGDRMVKLSADVPAGYDVSVDTGSHIAVRGFGSPRSVSVDSADGSCWAADYHGDKMVKLSADVPDGYDVRVDTGSHITVHGFGSLRSVSVNCADGSCWGADYDGDKVVKLSADVPDGYDVSVDTGSHIAVHGFSSPRSVSANSADGSCWVADYYTNKVFRLSAAGSRLVGVGGFNYPLSVSVNPADGTCWVAENNHDQVVKLSPNGTEMRRVSVYYDPTSVAVNPGTFGLHTPLPVATANPLVGEAPLEVTFTGSATDTDGTVVLYEWDWEGDGTYDWNSVENGNATYLYTMPGIFNPVLRVTDDSGLTGYEYSNIIRPGCLTDVEASVNPGQGNAPLQVQLTVSPTSPYAIILYEWDFDGDGTYDWSSTQQGNTSHTYYTGGIYPATARVTDEADQAATDSVIIVVEKSLPMAVANATPQSGEKPLVVTLDGSASYDPDGSIVLYEWDYDGDGVYDWASSTTGTTEYAYRREGTYETTLRVTDNDGLTSTGSVSITVGQLSPIALVSAEPLEGNVPLEVSFDGSASYDPEGAIESYAWDFDDGNTGDGPTAVHTYLSQGLYAAQLTVADDAGATGRASVEILAKPEGAPTAHANADPTAGQAPLTVVFTGTGVDPDGTIILYEWDFDGDGTYDWSSDSTGTTSYTYESKGLCTAVLRVTDDTGLTDTDSVAIIVGSPPISLPRAHPTEGQVPLEVTFTANGTDEDGTICFYQWDYDGDGVFDWTSTLPGEDHESGLPRYIYRSERVYTALLRVTDNDGLVGEASILITVEAQEGIPTAVANGSPSTGAPPLEVTLIGTGTDFDGTIKQFEWDFEGDSVYDWTSTLTGTTTYTYDTLGTYPATLRVTDNEDNTATDSVLITVKSPETPTAVAAASPTEGPAALNVDFEGVGSDLDGSIVLYEWDFDGDETYDWGSPVTGFVTYSYAVPGRYVAVFRVTDNDGLTAITVVPITVTFGISTTLSDEAFDPTAGQEITINSVLTGFCAFTLRIVDEQGNLVRALVNDADRTAGFYADIWNGKDDSGATVHSGVYRFIIEYEVGGQRFTYDLTGTADATVHWPVFDYPSEFSPYEDEPLTMQFTLHKAAEVTTYIAEVADLPTERIKTVFLRKPMKPGDYVIVWDGTDDEGNLAGPGLYCLCVMYWDLPDNTIIVSSEPIVSDFSLEPNYLRPAANPYHERPTILTLTYRLSKEADVLVLVQNERNITVRTLAFEDVPAGVETVTWDGRNEHGQLVHRGRYKIGIQATDSGGNTSLRAYSLFKVFY